MYDRNAVPVDIRRGLVFMILMANGDGYMEKAPRYLEEKWKRVHLLDEPEHILDKENRERFDAWMEKWTRRMTSHG